MDGSISRCRYRWLAERPTVLISPYALDPANEGRKVIPVDLTKTQIEKSPALATDRPVSRQYDGDYYSYYGWPGYWGGPYTWGLSAYPTRGRDRWSEASRRERNEDPHLCSTEAVTGCDIHAQDGDIGHVEDFVVDDETWAIRYLIVDTQNWWPGKKVLISTRWIERISWEQSANATARFRLMDQAPEIRISWPAGRTRRDFSSPPGSARKLRGHNSIVT